MGGILYRTPSPVLYGSAPNPQAEGGTLVDCFSAAPPRHDRFRLASPVALLYKRGMNSSFPTPKPGILDIAAYVGGKSNIEGVSRICKLSSNENPFGASPKVVEALRGLPEKLHRYPDGGAVAVRQAIADAHRLPVDQILCGAGSDELIGLLIHAYAGTGDEVLFSEHGFLMYRIYSQSANATPVTAPETGLRTDVEALLKVVTPRTKVVCVANPNNPTGSYTTREELHYLRERLPAHILLMVDAAYAEYVEQPDYTSGEELVAATENTVMLRTFSKIHGIPALRLGWAYAPPRIADVLQRARSPFNVSTAAQIAGIAALQDPEFVAKARAHNNAWLGKLSGALTALGLTVHPSVGNFLLVTFPGGKDQAEKANAHLLKHGIIVRAVAAYGLPASLRISIGLDAENEAVIAALTEYLR